mgnify:CR=1 FL=1
MNEHFLSELQSELQSLQSNNLYKKERIITSPQGPVILTAAAGEVINFCANNYLGLSSHPKVIEAAHKAIDLRGYGMSSVRFICGTQDIHKELEEKISTFLGTEDTILYAAAFDANGGVFEPLFNEQDAIISDALNHASIIDGVRLCKAQRFRYEHNDMNDLEAKLKEAAGCRSRIIVTDGSFSMDGTIARLEEEIYPLLVGDMGIPADRILKFHQGNRTHPIGKEAAAEFALLDDPASRKQIILLVQIGKEGWDCRSLTGVILSQKGDCPKNMVLQTSCRCLRQVDKDTDETALILLNETNAKVLDKQLGEEQNTSIKELNAIHKRQAESWVPRVSRMTHLTLPPVDFFQLKIKYLTVLTREKRAPSNALAGLDPDSAAFKTRATITTRFLIERHAADAVVLASGGYTNVYYLSTNAMGSNVTATWRAHKHGALMANPCYTQIHPTCIPQTGEYQSKLTLMSESLRNDGRIWVPRKGGDDRPPAEIPEAERYYYLEERYPAYGNLAPRDIASRAAKVVCDDGLGVGGTGRGVYLDFRDTIAERGHDEVEGKYGNLFEMYERITGENPYETPMMIYPAPHYAMGGLWVDYELQTTIPGLFAIGEANADDTLVVCVGRTDTTSDRAIKTRQARSKDVMT